MRTLVIDRRKWARGILGGPSALRNNSGNMCCLGFDAKACGFGPKSLKDAGTPEYILSGGSTLTAKTIVKRIPHLVEITGCDEQISDISFTIKAIEINDDDDITEAARENKLAELFGEQDIVLEFIN